MLNTYLPQASIKLALALLLTVLVSGLPTVSAEIVEQAIDYQDDGQSLRGYAYFDDSSDDKRPGILVVHEWWGLHDYARSRARQLAAMGYVAMAVDMYGVGQLADHPSEAREFMQVVTANVNTWRGRASAALTQLKALEMVDVSRIGAIGYCFGGATVLQLAYGGADLRGVVSFHGSLPIPEPRALPRIRASILVEHGAADSFVPVAGIAQFQETLEGAGVDWQMHYHAGAKHSFTNPDAAQHGMQGIAYNAAADARSWQSMRAFFAEVFDR